jgi:hypothetical protein
MPGPIEEEKKIKSSSLKSEILVDETEMSVSFLSFTLKMHFKLHHRQHILN